MQKIQLDARSKIVRYAYLLRGGATPFPGYPWRTTLCALFWRCVGTTVLLVSAAVILVGALLLAYLHPKETGEALATMAVAIGITLSGVAFLNWDANRRRHKRAKPPTKRVGTSLGTLIVRGYRGFKGKYCPLVEIQ